MNSIKSQRLPNKRLGRGASSVAFQLKPLLVALDELMPWLKQWHNALDPEFGERLGDYYEGFLLEELRQLELARDERLAWKPAAARRGRGR
ncbi:MAG: DUF7008 domain-containing protein [Halochromatium sp.]|uniref:DUF7008 domain-containing protein n=1 Tax=Halochromatium sp. TaxID=2049430 RepID=UPI00397871FC